MGKVVRFVFFISILILLPAGVLADDGDVAAIHDIMTEVSLMKNGNAVVYQVWDVTVTSGTEWYVPVSNVGNRRIRDLSVYEGDVKFEDDGRNWDSRRTLEEKTHRSGIVEKGNGAVELCWGQGEYGRHVYSVLYIIDDLVEAFDVGDGFHWHFLGDTWAFPPEHVSLKLINETEGPEWFFESPDSSNVRVWAFGFKGQVEIKDGEVLVETDEPFDYSSFMSVMVQWNKGLFSPKNKSSESFDALRDKAFNNDYSSESDKDSLGERIVTWLFIAVVCGVLLFILVLVLLFVYYLLSRAFRFITGRTLVKACFGVTGTRKWYRDIPLGGSMTAAYSLLQEGDDKVLKSDAIRNLVGAYFLKWILAGMMDTEKTEDGKINLRLNRGRPGSGPAGSFEAELYRAAYEASGTNGLLEAGEFVNWSTQHYSSVVSWPSLADREGRQVWEPMDFEDRLHLIEFRNYLSDFTLVSEREAPEVVLWRQYLVYAQIFGIAEKVMKSFSKLYPDMTVKYFDEVQSLIPGITSTASAVLRAAREKESSVKQSFYSSQDSSHGSYSSYSSRSSSSRSRSGGGGSSSYRGGGGGHGGGRSGGSR